MPATAQPTTAKIDPATLQLLVDNIANLEHPLAKDGLPHPRLKELAALGQPEVAQAFCEAIVLLLQKHKRLHVYDDKTIDLLAQNIANLENRPRSLVIKHPSFQERWAGNPEQVRQTARIYAEAIVLLLEKNADA